jgi:hypothetical protein
VLKNGVLLGAALVAVLAAGCGGGETLTKEQYVSKLNAMCRDFSEREKAIGEPQTLADLVEKGPRIRDAFEQAIAGKVGTLKAPDEIGSQAARLVDLAVEQRDVLGGLADAAKDNDPGKVQELAARNERLNRQADSIARNLGARACTVN